MESCGLFDLLDEEERHLVLEYGRHCRYGRNVFVFHAGDAGDCLHIIKRGLVAVQVGGAYGEPLTLAHLTVGDAFGEGALLAPNHRRTASIITVEPTDTLMLDADDYADLCRRRPRVNTLLNAALAAQVRRLTQQVVELVEVAGAIRVYRRLLALGSLYGVRGTNRPVPLTQAHLAACAMVKLRLVSRVVGSARDQGILEPQRGRIVVLDWERLAGLAGVDDRTLALR
jgi:CRP/FNR family cyclic AMP-dependent transcriptional regulator